MFTRILVPTDFSEPSDAALEYARGMAARFGATLNLLHVLEAPFVTGPLGSEAFTPEVPAVQAELFEQARTRLRHRVLPDAAGYLTTTEIVAGTSARSILDYARERGVDLIVMGTHGRTGMAHLLMGSVAEKVVRGAHCPVMTVRAAASEVPVTEPAIIPASVVAPA
jgi:universal stress protein A